MIVTDPSESETDSEADARIVTDPEDEDNADTESEADAWIVTDSEDEELKHLPELFKQLIEAIICNNIIEIANRLDELLRKDGITISEHAVFSSV